MQPNFSSVRHTRLSGGAPDSVRCARLVSGESAALGNQQRRTAKIHRTVRWCTRLSGEASSVNSSLSRKAVGRRGYNSPDCPVSQQSPAPTVGRAIFARHVDCTNGQLVHRTVFGAPINPEEQQSDMPNLEGDQAPDRLQNLSSGAPDCPGRHSTEGKDSLPCWPPTAPRCLEAIKGTPRRMEEPPKHSLSILKHPNSTLAHSLHCVSYLGSIRVVHSLNCHLSSSLHLCA
jgi:hypothetical protein